MDTRITDKLYTHRDGNNTFITPIKVDIDKLNDVTNMENYAKTDVIAIDEAQFFVNLVEAVETFLADNKIVWIAGLNADFQQQRMGEILDLTPKADHVIFTRALCLTCGDGTRASFTKKIVTGQNKIDIGSSNKYMAVCRKHL